MQAMSSAGRPGAEQRHRRDSPQAPRPFPTPARTAPAHALQAGLVRAQAKAPGDQPFSEGGKVARAAGRRSAVHTR